MKIALFSLILSFFITFLIIPHWIKRAKKIGLVGVDVQKRDKPKIAEVGGICVICGFLGGILFYIGANTFYFHSFENNLPTMAALATLLIITIIGLVDDILGWKIGLRQWQKPILGLVAALPMAVINAGTSEMVFPLIGKVDFGIFYPLIIVPIAITGAANGFNMIAGYNGLEAGMGVIILSFLSYVAIILNKTWVAVLALCMVVSLIAFLIYNKYPAKIFPGNTLTYSVGATIAIIAILGNMERVAVILFIPYFIEFFLKLRGKFKKESFSKVEKDGSLNFLYRKAYGLEHLALHILKKLKRKVYEKDIVFSILFFEIIFVIFAFFTI